METIQQAKPEIMIFNGQDGIESFYLVGAAVQVDNDLFKLLTEINIVNGEIVPVPKPDVFIAKYSVDAEGQEIYDDPTEEEFQIVLAELKRFEAERSQES